MEKRGGAPGGPEGCPRLRPSHRPAALSGAARTRRPPPRCGWAPRSSAPSRAWGVPVLRITPSRRCACPILAPRRPRAQKTRLVWSVPWGAQRGPADARRGTAGVGGGRLSSALSHGPSGLTDPGELGAGIPSFPTYKYYLQSPVGQDGVRWDLHTETQLLFSIATPNTHSCHDPSLPTRRHGRNGLCLTVLFLITLPHQQLGHLECPDPVQVTHFVSGGRSRLRDNVGQNQATFLTQCGQL